MQGAGEHDLDRAQPWWRVQATREGKRSAPICLYIRWGIAIRPSGRATPGKAWSAEFAVILQGKDIPVVCSPPSRRGNEGKHAARSGAECRMEVRHGSAAWRYSGAYLIGIIWITDGFGGARLDSEGGSLTSLISGVGTSAGSGSKVWIRWCGGGTSRGWRR